jgi:hypothetical protein
MLSMQSSPHRLDPARRHHDRASCAWLMQDRAGEAIPFRVILR